MSRAEFTSATKRDALKRSGDVCEGVGPIVGLKRGERCQNSLKHGVDYDHWNPDAHSKDNSLDNCRCLCLKCHKFKTTKRDIPMIAKGKRQKDKARSIRRRKGPLIPGSRKSKYKRLIGGGVVLR